jgi:predicted amidohydrolase
MPKIRASVMQTCTAAYSLADTLDKLERLTQLAAKETSSLAVFPEALCAALEVDRRIRRANL